MNAVTCHHCETRIESHYRHDWKACQCPDVRFVFVDGGQDYDRRGWGPEAWFTDEADGRVYDFRQSKEDPCD